MSQQMNQAKEIVEKIISEIEAGDKPEKESLLTRLQTIDKLITRNQSKIWLRTRSGKPMAEKLENAATKALDELESLDLSELESIAKEIDDESEKRSMIVT
ncbi:MAG: hypothetical protein NWF07_13680 [Candidatus Bathyarchaeota archaeon]|nr:hypothetical protein [Candidatus Bathyarchaeota archaeon]